MSKAFRFHEHGGPEVLRFEEIAGLVEVRTDGAGAGIVTIAAPQPLKPRCSWVLLM